MSDLYSQMLQCAAAVGLPIISKWTAAQILYIVYAYGGAREEFTLSPKFRAEMRYIQTVYGVDGGEMPDLEIIAYIKQLNAENEFGKPSQWASDFCKQRYGFSLN